MTVARKDYFCEYCGSIIRRMSPQEAERLTAEAV